MIFFYDVMLCFVRLFFAKLYNIFNYFCNIFKKVLLHNFYASILLNFFIFIKIVQLDSSCF